MEPFFRADRLETVDTRHDYGEERIEAIGMRYDTVLVVVYTMREDAIRIISERRAETWEQKKYYDREI